ncbi:hypothetical protein RFI_08979, partial [Reticulomyxa filosa]
YYYGRYCEVVQKAQTNPKYAGHVHYYEQRLNDISQQIKDMELVNQQLKNQPLFKSLSDVDPSSSLSSSLAPLNPKIAFASTYLSAEGYPSKIEMNNHWPSSQPRQSLSESSYPTPIVHAETPFNAIANVNNNGNNNNNDNDDDNVNVNQMVRPYQTHVQYLPSSTLAKHSSTMKPGQIAMKEIAPKGPSRLTVELATSSASKNPEQKKTSNVFSLLQSGDAVDSVMDLNLGI